MTCTECANWNLKSAGRMARHGFGNCAHLPRYQYVASGCDKIKPAEPAVIAARLAWLNKNERNQPLAL